MTQVNTRPRRSGRGRRSAARATRAVPLTPKQAAACCRPVDDLLDPALFKAVSDPTRVRLLACLLKCRRACTVSEVAECCSVDFSVVSRHLQVLKRAGIVAAEKQGRTVFYEVEYGLLCRTLRSLADAIEQCCPAERASECRGVRFGQRG